MNISDDSDENIFDAFARQAAGCESTGSLYQCSEDETCCEMLHLSNTQNGNTYSVDSSLESVMPTHDPAAVLPTSVDSGCKCDLQNNLWQDRTDPEASGLVECDLCVGKGSSVASMHCDGTDHTTSSLTVTECAVKSNSCLNNTLTTELTGNSRTAESVDSRVSINSSELDDELLAELENECNSMTTMQSDSISIDYSSVNGTVSPQVDHLSNDDLSVALASVQRRQQALECRLQNTLEGRKQLETENSRLECKLSASLEALEAAKHDMESAKLQFEATIEKQQNEVDELSESLRLQHEKHQQSIMLLQNEHQQKLDELMMLGREHQQQKESLVMRYVQAEHSNNELTERLQKAETKLRDWTKERDVALSKWKVMKEEKSKLLELCDSKTCEVTTLKRDVDKQKEQLSAAETKIKWNQNKLKAEQDAHKETKSTLENSEMLLMGTRNEIQSIWQQLRQMYFELQNPETSATSVSTKHEDCKTADIEEMFQLMKKDVNTLSFKLKEVSEELRTYKDKVLCLEVERLNQEDILSTFRDSLQSQQHNNNDLRGRLIQLERVETSLHETDCKLSSALRRVEELEQVNCEVASEVQLLSQREAQHLEFSGRLTEKNGCLQAENSQLAVKNETLSSQLQVISMQLATVSDEKLSLEAKLADVTSSTEEQISILQRQLEDEQKSLEATKHKVEDMEDEVKTLKRRHANSIKDLLRQLQHATRRMENGMLSSGNGKPVDTMSIGSVGSHNGSCGSLETTGLTVTNCDELTPREQSPVKEVRSQAAHCSSPVLNNAHELPQLVIKKNEKIEFLKDHIDQLVEELHRKSRIIQGYVVREEAGTLASESSDRAKVKMAKKGGIMASLYSHQSLDEGMTLGLSLEINGKLQALLEDTLLKNIKLKEGMDTLGKEIDWLSHENSRLKRECTSHVPEQQVASSDKHS